MRASRLGDEFGAFDAVMPSRTRRRGPAPRSHRAAWPVTTSVCTPPLGPLLAVANEDLPPLTASGTFCYGARTSGRSPCPGLGGRHRASPTRRARAASFILRLRLVTSQGSPYPSRSPRAHPSGWTRTQGSHPSGWTSGILSSSDPVQQVSSSYSKMKVFQCCLP